MHCTPSFLASASIAYNPPTPSRPPPGESARLVSRLLGDLLLTTDGYELLRGRLEAAERSAAAAADAAAPLRKEHSRLLRQNSHLHAEAIAAREASARLEAEAAASAARLADEAAALAFIVDTQVREAARAATGGGQRGSSCAPPPPYPPPRTPPPFPQ